MTDEVEEIEVEEKAEPLSLREEIESAAKEVADKDVPAPKEAKAEPVAKETKSIEPVAKSASVAPPNAWTAQSKAKWSELPQEIQAEVLKREQDVEKGMTKLDEDRNFGKSLKEIVTPYLPMITAEGGTPQKAVQALLDTAYRLRTSSPQAKGQLFMDMARQYGVDLSQISQQQQSPVNPQLQAIQSELEQLKFARQSELSQREQHEQATIQSEIQSFAANPENIHYEAVKAHMASLLQGGLDRKSVV